MSKTHKSDEEWRAQLTPEQYRITRQKGTERAFTGEYCDTKTPGTYQCVCCGQDLFHFFRQGKSLHGSSGVGSRIHFGACLPAGT